MSKVSRAASFLRPLFSNPRQRLEWKTQPAVGSSFLRICLLLVAVLGLVAGGQTASGAVLTWSNSGTTWAVASNWGGQTPGSVDIALFNLSSYNYQPAVSSGTTVGGIWDTGSATLTVSGASTLTLNGTATATGFGTNTGIQMDSTAGPLTITAPLALGGSQTWTNNSANLFADTNTLNNAGFLLTLSGSGNASLGGVISGSGGFTAAGTGLTTLSSSLNTYSGVTTVGGGTLSVGNIVVAGSASGLGNATSAVALGGGGDLSYSGTSVTYTRGFTINAGGGEFDVTNAATTVSTTNALSLANGNMTFGGAGGTSYAGVISGTGGVIVVGNGTVTLAASNTYSGATVLSNAGTLSISGSQNLGNGATTNTLSISNGGTLLQTAAVTFALIRRSCSAQAAA